MYRQSRKWVISALCAISGLMIYPLPADAVSLTVAPAVPTTDKRLKDLERIVADQGSKIDLLTSKLTEQDSQIQLLRVGIDMILKLQTRVNALELQIAEVKSWVRPDVFEIFEAGAHTIGGSKLGLHGKIQLKDKTVQVSTEILKEYNPQIFPKCSDAAMAVASSNGYQLRVKGVFIDLNDGQGPMIKFVSDCEAFR